MNSTFVHFRIGPGGITDGRGALEREPKRGAELISRRRLELFGLIMFITIAGCHAQSEEQPGRGSADSENPAGIVSVISERGVFRVSVWPERGKAPVRQLHVWRVRVEDEAGRIVRPKKITIGGGMEQHGHGFDSTPRVTERLANGDYRIEGMKFHMSGEWQLIVEIEAPQGTDLARFRMDVGL